MRSLRRLHRCGLRDVIKGCLRALRARPGVGPVRDDQPMARRTGPSPTRSLPRDQAPRGTAAPYPGAPARTWRASVDAQCRQTRNRLVTEIPPCPKQSSSLPPARPSAGPSRAR
ncbi:hypothetical protein D0Z08_27095 [Nocardioides immobilis]|uniref:Uncharacterized protein n=1 Tax=Nocardioides immobilis TaxID=2049295 RepID=A0A417XUD8_9ACTN|nr:hypothetical protein D0Z08_27095 [Nocardioides immobilis]